MKQNNPKIIPGFHYEISRNGELWNINTGKLIRPGSDGRYLLRKEKRMYRFTYGRLLYAAEHGICPDFIKGIVIMTEDNKPVLTTRGDYCKKVIIPFRHSSSQRDLAQRYREAVRIATVMIDFYEKVIWRRWCPLLPFTNQRSKAICIQEDSLTVRML